MLHLAHVRASLVFFCDRDARAHQYLTAAVRKTNDVIAPSSSHKESERIVADVDLKKNNNWKVI
jgi:hypothetical protein